MPAVTRVKNLVQPTGDETRRMLLELQDKPCTQVSLDVDGDTWFVIEYVAGAGYFMSGCGPSDKGYFNLIDSRLGDEITAGTLAYEDYFFPRYALVSQDTLLRAAKTFFETGERDPSCEWVPEQDAVYT